MRRLSFGRSSDPYCDIDHSKGVQYHQIVIWKRKKAQQRQAEHYGRVDRARLA